MLVYQPKDDKSEYLSYYGYSLANWESLKIDILEAAKESENLFQWVELNQDVPRSLVKKGARGVIVETLKSMHLHKEDGYIIEVFQDGETLDVVSVPVSWVTLLPEKWGQIQDSKVLITETKTKC